MGRLVILLLSFPLLAPGAAYTASDFATQAPEVCSTEADGHWVAISSNGAPSPRRAHVSAWTGDELLVWGGESDRGEEVGDGARYRPSSDTWAPMTEVGAPSARLSAAGVWTGTELIVLGGAARAQSALPDRLWDWFWDGGRYHPESDTWTPISLEGAPTARQSFLYVWDGNALYLWGGFDPDSHELLDDGSL